MSNIDRLAYNRLGQLFTAANNAATSHIAVTSIMTGLAIYNPPGNTKVLAIVDFTFQWTTAPAAVHQIGLAMIPTSPTALTTATAATVTGGVRSADCSGNAGTSQAQAYSAFTGPTTAVACRWPGGCIFGSGVGESPYSIVDAIDGGLIVRPGGAIITCALTNTCVGVASFSWVELPL